MQMKCIVPFVKDLVSNQPKSRTRKDKRDDRKSRERNARRGERNPWKRTDLKFALSTPSHSGSYHIPDGGDFLKPLVTKSSLNIENLNSKNIKPMFLLQQLRELLAKGYVDNDVIEDLQSLEHKLAWKRKRREKKKQTPKRNMNPISSYFHKKASTSQGKSQDGSDETLHPSPFFTYN